MSEPEVSPEPTFLEKLRKAREAATPLHPSNSEFVKLLINNSEKIERLIEAAENLDMDEVYGDYDLQQALTSLNGETE